jgi:hypothetical protein
VKQQLALRVGDGVQPGREGRALLGIEQLEERDVRQDVGLGGHPPDYRTVAAPVVRPPLTERAGIIAGPISFIIKTGPSADDPGPDRRPPPRVAPHH